ncbi:pseudouridylate synthase [Lawsonia intracellularis]|nr:pseudouridylate synthase [Lawsonia intracellularis]
MYIELIMQPIIVSSNEAGQKLFQFLTRRLTVPKSILHRWIRTGQTRINGKRVTPFTIVNFKDKIRIPPFAYEYKKKDLTTSLIHNQYDISPISSHTTSPLPPVIAHSPEFIIFYKPAGLAVHGGTGQTDSLAHRLSQHYAHSTFMPTPVHRLDKDTSGLLLVAKTYNSLRYFSELFASHSTQLTKEYLAWVVGICPWTQPICLEDILTKKQKQDNYSRLNSYQNKLQQTSAQKASLTVRCIKQYKDKSLLLIKLHTGRTHQIRIQLSLHGFPIIGDKKYGNTIRSHNLKLHAFRLSFPGYTFTILPSWDDKWQVTQEDIPN